MCIRVDRRNKTFQDIIKTFLWWYCLIFSHDGLIGQLDLVSWRGISCQWNIFMYVKLYAICKNITMYYVPHRFDPSSVHLNNFFRKILQLFCFYQGPLYMYLTKLTVVSIQGLSGPKILKDNHKFSYYFFMLIFQVLTDKPMVEWFKARLLCLSNATVKQNKKSAIINILLITWISLQQGNEHLPVLSHGSERNTGFTHGTKARPVFYSKVGQVRSIIRVLFMM